MSETLLLVLGLIITIGVGVIIVLLLRPRAAPVDLVAERRIAELTGHMQALQQTVHQTTHTLGQSMQTSTKHTTDHLQQLHARLAVIDTAQKNITDLATQVTSLQNVLANKQSRGAFGQGRMETIVADGMPKGAFEFQFTLSNRARPDCCVLMPDKRHLVIDAKFPLEAVTAFREAKTDDAKVQAARQLRQDVGKHVADIAEKYLLPGETQDLALMFVPSESVYAELYDGFDDIFQKAYRAKVIIVSPSLLMLAIQVIQQIRKDARMREAADKILTEVGLLVTDVSRMRDRVENLEKHFGNVNTDIKQIVISADKIVERGERIQSVEFGKEQSAQIIPGPGARKLEAGE
jgi:DNA recombination protein RmuC